MSDCEEHAYCWVTEEELTRQRDCVRDALISTLSLLKCFVNPESDDLARVVVEQAENALALSR